MLSKNEFQNSKILVIYHNEDNDGVCSAAIVSAFYKHCQDHINRQIDLFGSNYKDLNDIWDNHMKSVRNSVEGGSTEGLSKDQIVIWESSYDLIFMVDISFNNPDAMVHLYDAMPIDSFIWCDHHESAINNSIQYGYDSCPGIRRTDQSAILNTWDYMESVCGFGIHPSDSLIMLSDYDSWQWAKKNRYNSEYNRDELFALNKGFTEKSELKADWFEHYIYFIFYNSTDRTELAYRRECIELGKLLLGYDSKRIGNVIRDCGDYSWTVNNRPACVLFTTEHFNSNAFKANCQNILNGVTFKKLCDDNWTMSLYNIDDRDDFHCGNYLKSKYGGGGHKGAAGCVLSTEQVMNLIETKKI